MKALTTPFLIGLTLLLGACGQETSSAKAQFQTEASAILYDYTRGVSKYFPRRVASHGFQGPSLPFNDQPYGGYTMRPVTQDVQDCLEWVESVPEKVENYQFMVGAFSRCLNRIMSNRNPLMSAYARALPGQGQNDMAWSQMWRQQQPVDYFNQASYNQVFPQISSGYPNTQDMMYQGF